MCNALDYTVNTYCSFLLLPIVDIATYNVADLSCTQTVLTTLFSGIIENVRIIECRYTNMFLGVVLLTET